MSGHSKWAKIKHQKAAGDLKKGMIFTKLGHAVTLAAREGGGDPDMNFMLRMAIEKAKEANMPKNNIERAIKKGMGELEGQKLETITYEIIGKDGAALIVEAMTDNSNRTLTEVRTVVSKAGFNLGKALWQFEPKGRILLEPKKKVESEKFSAKGDVQYEDLDKDELILELMEIAGVLDVSTVHEQDVEGENVEMIELITQKDKVSSIFKDLAEEQNLKVHKAEVAQLPKNEIAISDDLKEKVEHLIEELEQIDDVTAVWPNV
jgi:YebC/PmpR family DNA-binding regulatory protein